MEPLTTAGGIIGVAWDVFDNAMRLFKFFSALVDMPKECEKYRLQLIIEYNRVLAWGKAAGFVHVPEGGSLAVTLGTNATELVGIVSRIQWLLAEFRELNSRYGNELNPEASSASTSSKKATASVSPTDVDVDVVKQVSSLAVSYEAEKKARRHRRGTNHIRDFLGKAGRNTKEIVTHPARVRWVAVDKEEFETLLRDLHVLTERLHELMRDYRGRRIDDITAKTYREMILARNDIQGLKDMFDAVTSLINTSSSTRRERYAHHNDRNLQDLVQLKKISRTSDAILSRLKARESNGGGDGTSGDNSSDDVQASLEDEAGITVRKYTEEQLAEDLDWNEPPDLRPETLARPHGILNTHGRQGNIPVWIEWKALGDFAPGSAKDQEAALRTVALAEMLHLPKPETLHAPECVGYFDDREVSGAERYGWIFKMPEGCDYESRVVSLYDFLLLAEEGDDRFKPTLAQRVAMARALCSTLLNLHAVNWLHKGIFSDNIVFHFHEETDVDDEDNADGSSFDPEKPVLSGFEFSRPDGGQTTHRDADTVWDLYRWPSIQRQPPTERNSRKTYDLYSLGLVLLEIAHWRPLHRILNLGGTSHNSTSNGENKEKKRRRGGRTPLAVPLEQSKLVRDWLLGLPTPPQHPAPFLNTAAPSNPLAELRHLVGDRYCSAVTRCLWAHGASGFGVDELAEQSNDSRVGIELQQAFTEFVVEELASIQL
ncbi:prion-inhibition and propagation-domain-containing protein [Lasiosphaeria miniovina]|uniref:Prion-inhibition and propagation-domain-containing protein n=1 Tax=Lasiosphaeria miniovina TaxID=1954250 RepID=A0AA40A5N5_9PEZI|nr:prion-inhibition and propagation-domain-containing protein [Lasiosphaeria miniovina]KAK0709739.1 prion-inhibition and propagation-domain-containing protein [Lasiosphaeria miniovina]